MTADPRVSLADDIFCCLVGESHGTYEDVTQIRSEAYTNTVDVLLGDQWFRVSAEPIHWPISVARHRGLPDDD